MLLKSRVGSKDRGDEGCVIKRNSSIRVVSGEPHDGVTRLAINSRLIALKFKLIIVLGDANIGIKFRVKIVVIDNKNCKRYISY